MNQHEAYSRATALCSKSEKCISDIRKKLFDWGVDVAEHENVIQALVENKYVDEERFAEYYVRDKYRFNGWGRVKIRYHLQQKNISHLLIDKAFDGVDNEAYVANLRRALELKVKGVKSDSTYEKRQKLVRFAAGRGYSLDEINAVIDDYID